LARASILALALLAHGAGSVGASIGIPTPADDPFYQPPAGYVVASHGTVLRARTITATILGVPLPVKAWQLLIRSRDSGGAPTAEVVTVMVPNAKWAGPGARPVVSYQVAEDSVGAQCAPSYVIRGGLAGITSNAAPETGLVATLLLKRWAVVTTDYEGPRSEFLAAGQEAHGVLDGLQGALSYAPDTLSARDPVALWGYSGGAFATAWATQLQARYAPRLRFVGIAIGGTPSAERPRSSRRRWASSTVATAQDCCSEG
jgi:hypothetical protein